MAPPRRGALRPRRRAGVAALGALAGAAGAVAIATAATGGVAVADVDVLIIGAGWAGMGAADRLIRGNVSNIVVLEASNRTGGRTVAIPDFGNASTVGTFVVERGSNWVSGVGGGVGGVGQAKFPDVARNPVAVLAQRSGLDTRRIAGSTQNMSNYAAVYDSDGSVADASGDLRRRSASLYDGCVNQTCARAGPELTLRQALQQCGWEPQSDVDWAMDWVLTVDNPGIVAEKQAAAETLPDETYWWWGNNDDFVVDQSSPRGWARVIDEMVADTLPPGDARLVLNARVVRVAYDDGAGPADCIAAPVNVTTADGRVFRARQVISTLPLGVLQRHHAGLFAPPLSPARVEVLTGDGIVMGNLTHVLLQFPTVWWDDALPRWVSANAGSAANHTVSGEFAEWQNLNYKDHIPGSHTLLSFLGDPQSSVYEGMADADARAGVMARLRQQHPNTTIPDPVAFFISRHGYDPLSFGAYSGFEPGWRDKFYDTLAKPLRCGGEQDDNGDGGGGGGDDSVGDGGAGAGMPEGLRQRATTRAESKQRRLHHRGRGHRDNDSDAARSRVFFAGEAMCDNLSGFTHGALQSGIEAAARLLHQRGLGPNPADVDALSLCDW